MRSASTSRPSSVSRSRAAAPPVYASASESAFHSACHAPAARSCSCSTRRSTPAAAWTCSAQARTSTEPTGFRLCGIVDEPAVAGLAHLGDLRLREQREVERDLRAEARGDGERGAELGDRQPTRVPRQHRLGQVELAASSARSTSRPRSPSEASVPPAPPSCAGRRAAARRRRAWTIPTSQLAAFSPNVVGTACWSSVRAAVTLARCSSASRAHARATPSSSSSIERRSRCARRARRRCRGCPGSSRRDARARDRSRNARTSGSTGLPAPRPASASSAASRPSAAKDVVAELGDHARARLRAVRERALGVEHRSEPRLVRDRLAQRRRHEDRRERRQCAKNTVCRSPCSRMSKRRPPPSARRRASRGRRRRAPRAPVGVVRRARPGSRCA